MALRLWWARQQRPTARSVDYAVDVERPALTVESASILAVVALTLALGLTIHEAAALGWHGIEGAAWFAVALGWGAVGVALGFLALTRRFR